MVVIPDGSAPSMKKAEVRRLKTEGAATSIQAGLPSNGQAVWQNLTAHISILDVFSR